MGITKDDTVIPILSNEKVNECISTALTISSCIADRHDLHDRSALERFENVVMGELSEQAVIQFLRENGKIVYAPTYAQKTNGKPDGGYDVEVVDICGNRQKVSIKSSLSVYKQSPEEIVENPKFHLASKRSELRAINIQVYFWLDTKGSTGHRTAVPSEKNMMIVGWVCGRKIRNASAYSAYATEGREVVEVSLKELRPMSELLQYLI